MTSHTTLEHTAEPKTRNGARPQAANRGSVAPREEEYVGDSVGDYVEEAYVEETSPLTEVDVNLQLLELLARSAQSLQHAAESVENRGLKLLLKVVAQDRVYMVNSLRTAMGQPVQDSHDPATTSASASLQEGLQEIQASMTVKQQGREHVTLKHLMEDEDKLLKAYSVALGHSSSMSLTDMLAAQRATVEQFNQRMHGVKTGVEPIVARVFDTLAEGEEAALRLQNSGLQPSQVDAVPINYVAQPVLQSTETRRDMKNGPQNTIVAGAVGGLLVGGIVGLALAAFVWLAPQLIGWITVGPWALLFGSAVFAAIVGAVFGFFIGQNQRELDQAVTADGLINGEMLVVAYPQPQQVALTEEVLQVHHARELNR